WYADDACRRDQRRPAGVHQKLGQQTDEHMKALRFHKFGSPSVLAIEEVPRPEPHGGEALVQVQAAAINPSDVKNVSGFSRRQLCRELLAVISRELWLQGRNMKAKRSGAAVRVLARRTMARRLNMSWCPRKPFLPNHVT